MWESITQGENLSSNFKGSQNESILSFRILLWVVVPSGTNYIYLDRSVPQNKASYLEHLVMVF